MVAKVPSVSNAEAFSRNPRGHTTEEVLRLKASTGTKAQHQVPGMKLKETIQYCKEGRLCFSHQVPELLLQSLHLDCITCWMAALIRPAYFECQESPLGIC